MFLRDFREMLSSFSDERVEFLLVGAVAMAVHAVPRATGDMDLWVRPDAMNARRVWKALAQFGAPLAGISAEEFSRPGAVLQVGVAPVRIDVLTSIEGVEFDDAWLERVEVEAEGLRIPVIGRRHLVMNERACGRPKDLLAIQWLEAGDDV